MIIPHNTTYPEVPVDIKKTIEASGQKLSQRSRRIQGIAKQTRGD